MDSFFSSDYTAYRSDKCQWSTAEIFSWRRNRGSSGIFNCYVGLAVYGGEWVFFSLIVLMALVSAWRFVFVFIIVGGIITLLFFNSNPSSMQWRYQQSWWAIFFLWVYPPNHQQLKKGRSNIYKILLDFVKTIHNTLVKMKLNPIPFWLKVNIGLICFSLTKCRVLKEWRTLNQRVSYLNNLWKSQKCLLPRFCWLVCEFDALWRSDWLCKGSLNNCLHSNRGLARTCVHLNLFALYL